MNEDFEGIKTLMNIERDVPIFDHSVRWDVDTVHELLSLSDGAAREVYFHKEVFSEAGKRG